MFFKDPNLEDDEADSSAWGGGVDVQARAALNIVVVVVVVVVVIIKINEKLDVRDL